MKAYSISDFERQISKIESKSMERRKICEEKILFSNKVLSELRMDIIANDFLTMNEEVHFFKFVKPTILQTIFFNTEIWKIDFRLSFLSTSSRNVYLNKKIKCNSSFLSKYQEFIQYIESDSTYLDQYYFTRKHNNQFHILNNEFGIFDSKFNSLKDILLAKIKASQRFIRYITEQESNSSEITTKTPLKWTNSKASLAELIYALYSARVINNGSASIKQISENLQRTFNIEIGDIYRIFSEIRNRKKERAKFINFLEFSILKNMEILDD